MKIISLLGALLLSMAVQTFAEDSPDAALDALHQAGADANQITFIALLADDAIFLGAGDGGRLEGQSLRDFIATSFSGGKSWAYRSSERETRMSPDGSVAWFDESLENDQLGRGRGTGVLIRDSEGWKIAQYNITVPLSGVALRSGAGLTGQVAPATHSPDATGTAVSESPDKPECTRLRHKTNRASSC